MTLRTSLRRLLPRVACVHSSTGPGCTAHRLTRETAVTALSRTCHSSVPLGTKAVLSECCLFPGGHSCPLCLQLLLPVLLLVLSVTLILAFWILPKYKASKSFGSFSIVFHGFWIQTAGEGEEDGERGIRNGCEDVREEEAVKGEGEWMGLAVVSGLSLAHSACWWPAAGAVTGAWARKTLTLCCCHCLEIPNTFFHFLKLLFKWQYNRCDEMYRLDCC